MATHARELPVDEAPRQQRIEWRLQRVAWALLCLLLVAVMLGLLGQGPLARTQVHGDGGAVLDQARFGRREAPQTLWLQATPATRQLELALDNRLLQQAEIEQVVPQPREVVAGPERTLMRFDADAGRVLVLQLRLRAQQSGWLQGGLLVDGRPLRLSQFVFP